MVHTFEALGTRFSITFFDEGRNEEFQRLARECEKKVRVFDALYSRFKSDSLVSELSRGTGSREVPRELVEMLRLYQKLNRATDGKINPAIGFLLEDVGYDAAYSLTPKEEVRKVYLLDEALSIEDDTHITLHESVLLDLGALGKGYIIDQLHAFLLEAGIEKFLIDGSGDIRYFSKHDEPIVCGLEDPTDTTKVIGTISITGGALCASATNRRRWHGYNHYIDPESGVSPEVISAVWVKAETAVLADGLSSALFFTVPEAFSEFQFEYLVVNQSMGIKKSAGFAADLFSA